MKGRLRLILGIVISVLCLYYVVRGIDPRKLWETFRQVNALYLVPALIVLVALLWVRAYRWRLLMYPDEHIPLARLFSIVNIGYLFNNIIPAKVGELVRAYLVGRMVPGGIGQAL
jgi:glycosyltransferase 2 family protein